jgi:hypothetical protein
MKQYAGDYQKYMAQGSQSGSGSGQSGQSQTGADYQQYMKKYAGDYQKYAESGGSSSRATPMQLSAGKSAQTQTGADYQQYMKQYAGDYQTYQKKYGNSMPRIHNKSNSTEWRDAFMKKYVDASLPSIHNKSDSTEWRDAYMKRYADNYGSYGSSSGVTPMQLSAGKSTQTQTGADYQQYMKQHAGDYQNYQKYYGNSIPQIHNQSNSTEWRDAFMKKYVEEYLPNIRNKSDSTEWRDAYMKKYADKDLPNIHNKSNSMEWRDAFMKKYAGNSAEWQNTYAGHYVTEVRNKSDSAESQKEYAGKDSASYSPSSALDSRGSKALAAPVQIGADGAAAPAAPAAPEASPQVSFTAVSALRGNADAKPNGSHGMMLVVLLVGLTIPAMLTLLFRTVRAAQLTPREERAYVQPPPAFV